MSPTASRRRRLAPAWVAALAACAGLPIPTAAAQEASPETVSRTAQDASAEVDTNARTTQRADDAAEAVSLSAEEVVPARQHALLSFAVGSVGPSGFGAGFLGAFGWDIDSLAGVELGIGVGGMQERGGGAVGGVYAHLDVMFPVTFNICASVPRVCPALDLELAVLPGLSYGYLDGLHSGSLIVGFAISSLRKTQKMDVGVRASVLTYFDIVGTAMEEDADRLLGLVLLQLGCIIRWGVTQP